MGSIPTSSSLTVRRACALNRENFPLRFRIARCRCDQYFFCGLLRTARELNRSSWERPIFACSHLFRALFGVCRLRDHLCRWPNSFLPSIPLTSIQACLMNRPAWWKELRENNGHIRASSGRERRHLPLHSCVSHGGTGSLGAKHARNGG